MSVEAVTWALGVPVGGNQKVVLIGLANHAHADGSEAYPTLDTLAMYASCDRSTARRNVRRLVESGWIVPAGHGPYGQVKYQLRVDFKLPQDGLSLDGLVVPAWRNCVYCGAAADVLDHVIPSSNGGPDGPSNRVPACLPCNAAKGALSLEQWAAKSGRKAADLHAAVSRWQNATLNRGGVAPAPQGGGTSAPKGVAPMPPEPSIEPSQNHQTGELADLEQARLRLRRDEVTVVFDEWVAATGRDAARTKLTADRRRRIEKALASHGAEDCLAAVRNIGADAWARGANDRNRRFDDIEHALGSTARIERWRDQRPRQVTESGRLAHSGDLSRFDRKKGAA